MTPATETDEFRDSFQVISADGTPLSVWAGAHTAPRECRVEEAWEYLPGQFDGIDAPTLLLSGSESPASVKQATHSAAEAVSDARIHVLERHGHFAHRTDPAMVVSIIREFSLR